MPDVEIAGIYGLSETRAQPLADELGTSWTTELDKLISDPTIDAIDICLPGLGGLAAQWRPVLGWRGGQWRG